MIDYELMNWFVYYYDLLFIMIYMIMNIGCAGVVVGYPLDTVKVDMVLS